MSWAATEFESIDLGDPRRNRRAIRLFEHVSANPAASITQHTSTGLTPSGPTASSATRTFSGLTSLRPTSRTQPSAWPLTKWFYASKTPPNLISVVKMPAAPTRGSAACTNIRPTPYQPRASRWAYSMPACGHAIYATPLWCQRESVLDRGLRAPGRNGRPTAPDQAGLPSGS